MSNFSIDHSGVKGMKWGVRKERSPREQKVRDKRKLLSEQRRIISSKDLDATIERIQKEKKLKQLVDEDLNPGKRAVNAIISESGQKVARTVLAGATLYGIKLLIQKKFGKTHPDATSFITPKPKR